MRTIGVVTAGRSDYGIYLPLLRKIQEDPELKLYLMVTGMHLSPEFGSTVHMIEEDKFEINERIEMLETSDTPQGIAESIGRGTVGFAKAYSRFRPDVLVVLGDRFEMYAAALAALPFKIPIAHIHGGEVTQGAFDDALRHSITKLSHLHFVSIEEYARRVIQMGEEPWRVMVSGAPGLDNLRSTKLLDAKELKAKFGLSFDHPPLLVTYHPVTLEYEKTEWQVGELLAALETFEMPIIFTSPNADTNGHVVRHLIQQFIKTHPSTQFVDNLGTQAYFSLMALSAAMVGNSSSGIIEATSFNLPAVNIGTRQQGRIRAKNVIDVGDKRTAIVEGIQRALEPSFRQDIMNLENPYRCDQGSDKLIDRLKTFELNEAITMKRFFDLPQFLFNEYSHHTAFRY